MYIFWFILSIVKFQYCMTISTLFMDNSWYIFDTMIGGFFGVILFTIIGKRLQSFLVNLFPNRFRRFSNRTRFMVRLRRFGGVTGISILTPILLGIPLGVMILSTLTNDRYTIYLNMFLSISVWTGIFYIISLI